MGAIFFLLPHASGGHQLKELLEFHQKILLRLEGGGLCDKNGGRSKRTPELTNPPELHSQQADGKSGRHKVGVGHVGDKLFWILVTLIT